VKLALRKQGGSRPPRRDYTKTEGTSLEAARAYHVPVMREEVLALLDARPGKVFVDATVGGGGHAAAVAARIAPGGRLIGLDQDPEALAEAARTLAPFGDIVTLVQTRFDALPEALDRLGIQAIDGILFDFGVSSHQLDTPERGFSFKEPDAPLDMRMAPAQGGPTAADLLNTLTERELTTLIRENSDEHWAARIAKFIVERRQAAPYQTVGPLVETVLAAMPAGARPEDKHAATLRIVVNDELNVLAQALEHAVARLAPGGVIVTLAYHSLEDRIVKHLFARLAGRGAGEGPYGARPSAVLELLTKRPLTPAATEIAANPRARSALLRAARRLTEILTED
jgi:16S rRNA (cytosine1402-N4)-methyltransferase